MPNLLLESPAIDPQKIMELITNDEKRKSKDIDILSLSKITQNEVNTQKVGEDLSDLQKRLEEMSRELGLDLDMDMGQVDNTVRGEEFPDLGTDEDFRELFDIL